MDEVEKQNPPSENNTPLYPGHKTNHPGENSSMNPRWQLLKVWKALVIVLTPLVLLPIPLLWREKVKFTPINSICKHLNHTVLKLFRCSEEIN